MKAPRKSKSPLPAGTEKCSLRKLLRARSPLVWTSPPPRRQPKPGTTAVQPWVWITWFDYNSLLILNLCCYNLKWKKLKQSIHSKGKACTPNSKPIPSYKGVKARNRSPSPKWCPLLVMLIKAAIPMSKTQAWPSAISMKNKAKSQPSDSTTISSKPNAYLKTKRTLKYEEDPLREVSKIPLFATTKELTSTKNNKRRGRVFWIKKKNANQ